MADGCYVEIGKSRYLDHAFEGHSSSTSPWDAVDDEVTACCSTSGLAAVVVDGCEG